MLESLRTHSANEVGEGVSEKSIRDLEQRLDLRLPEDFRAYLSELNYAELFGDPIFGLNPDMPEIDLYEQNKYKEHFRYGFLMFFSNDIDGQVFLRPDSGAIYTAAFDRPIADS